MSQYDFIYHVPAGSSGRRLDQLGPLIDGCDGLSRSRIQSLIRSGNILVNEQSVKKAGQKVRSGDQICVTLPPAESSELIPEKVDFDILYEDGDIIVLSKPPGVVVHPAHGHSHGTLVHGLLYHCKDLAGIGGELRPGIVHRLDKDTSGVMVVAKNDTAHTRLVDQFKGRSVEKRYHAILAGIPRLSTGKIIKNIGRHPIHRKKMSILENGGREAVTGWTVLEDFGKFSYVELHLETGRTHQIRVHMSWLGCPVAGDSMYGGKQPIGDLPVVRQCLHSSFLSFNHPLTGKRMSLTAPLWPDMVHVLDELRLGN